MSKLVEKINNIETIRDGIDIMMKYAEQDHKENLEKTLGYSIDLEKNKYYLFNWGYTKTQKYIRVWRETEDGTKKAFAFIVRLDNDKLFRRGDILLPRSWKKPARNQPRGNVFNGDYYISFIGPMELNTIKQLKKLRGEE
jgi:hypothetical protein|tara:strand:- start:792 stop:1211 length:420 start_codon:yes stop_codon:yes gene_type:complete